VRRLSGEYWTTIDTVLMGRKTYEVARAHGQGAYPGVTNYVFSKTMTADPEPNVQLVRDDPVQFVIGLKQAPGRGICVMGGGELAQTFFEADLIDEVGANIHPVILGSGVPLLRPLSHEIQLELIRWEAISGDCLYVLYRVRSRGDTDG
jgi:dihydrofolate reductase